MKQIYVLIYSKYSTSSNEFINLLNSSNLNIDFNYLCIDNPTIRQRVIDNKNVDVTSVPCLLIASMDLRRIDKYEGHDCFNWINFLIEQNNNNNINSSIQTPISPENNSLPSLPPPPVSSPSSSTSSSSIISEISEDNNNHNSSQIISSKPPNFSENEMIEGDIEDFFPSNNNNNNHNNNNEFEFEFEEEEDDDNTPTPNDMASQLQAHFKSRVAHNAQLNKQRKEFGNLPNKFIDTSISVKSNKKRNSLMASAMEMQKLRETEEKTVNKVPRHFDR